MSTYAVGDLQGCRAELETLLDRINFDPAADTVWFLGDLVNRGPDNLGTVRLVRSLGDRARCVLGNHDLHFLAVAAGQHPAVRKDTLHDLLAAPELMEIVEWLRHLPLLHHDAELDFTMVHAGLPPIWDLPTSLERAREVEAILTSDAYPTFLSAMYGNQPATWSDHLSGMARARVITNYFTRLRYCKEDGELELTFKGTDCPDGYAPWFSHPRPLHDGVRILFGHWAALEGVCDASDCHALDTGCIWGRELTAMRLEDGLRVSVPAFPV
tara:strand:+ start:2147 stop:2956 length:810 start_codon:yes stop_codon:yes gene_type:complete